MVFGRVLLTASVGCIAIASPVATPDDVDALLQSKVVREQLDQEVGATPPASVVNELHISDADLLPKIREVLESMKDEFKGEQGPKGEPGIDGINGDHGIHGNHGTDGTDGVQGEKGEKGEQGDNAIRYFLTQRLQSCKSACDHQGQTCDLSSINAAMVSVAKCREVVESIGKVVKSTGEVNNVRLTGAYGCVFNPKSEGMAYLRTSNGIATCEATHHGEQEGLTVCACL